MWQFNSFLAFGATPPIAFLLFLEAPRAQQEQTAEPTRIESNSENDEIHFYVDGRLAAALKSDGLHIREDINYGGTLMNYCRNNFDNFTENQDADLKTISDGQDVP